MSASYPPAAHGRRPRPGSGDGAEALVRERWRAIAERSQREVEESIILGINGAQPRQLRRMITEGDGAGDRQRRWRGRNAKERAGDTKATSDNDGVRRRTATANAIDLILLSNNYIQFSGPNSFSALRFIGSVLQRHHPSIPFRLPPSSFVAVIILPLPLRPPGSSRTARLAIRNNLCYLIAREPNNIR